MQAPPVKDGPPINQEIRATRVLLPGYTRTPQDWLAAFDCFVSAARSEPFGLVFLEAMQAGLPVIASRTQGALHLSPHMQPTLVDVDDLPALRAALQPLQAIRFDAQQTGELAQLRRAESQDVAPRLHGHAMLAGFYINELVMRLTPRQDPLPELYVAYGELRGQLDQADRERLAPSLARRGREGRRGPERRARPER